MPLYKNLRQLHQTAPFRELMCSWNGKRPENPTLIEVRLYTHEWSPWFPYASWGKNTQKSFAKQEGLVQVYQDVASVLEGFATGFEVRGEIERLHVFTDGENRASKVSLPDALFLPVIGLSQMTLAHERNCDLCSPTSVAAVLRYLCNKGDPLEIATQVYDQKFHIFGNWVLNVAEAAAILGPTWDVWVERLTSFESLAKYLAQNTPVIVSVRGPLPGSALPYAKGHLLVVTGYDLPLQKVFCMDPAFPNDAQTLVSYHLTDFITAWSRRGNLAYLFVKR